MFTFPPISEQKAQLKASEERCNVFKANSETFERVLKENESKLEDGKARFSALQDTHREVLESL